MPSEFKFNVFNTYTQHPFKEVHSLSFRIILDIIISTGITYNSVYFLLDPFAFSTGYFASFIAIFFSTSFSKSI